MPADVARFLEGFTAFGAEPSVESYLPLFHPDATLYDSGMPRPVGVAEIPAHIEGILKLVPDFRMTPQRWRERGGTLFVEASNRATLGPAPVTWAAVYCIDLRGDRAIRGRRYYDRRPLFARLDPTLPELPGRGAGALARALPERRQTLLSWAGDDALLFLEWQVEAEVGGAPFRLGLAERLEGVDGVVRDGRAYFDSLELAVRLAAAGAGEASG